MNRRRIAAWILLLCFVFALAPGISFAGEIPDISEGGSADSSLIDESQDQPSRTDYIRYESLILSYNLNEDGTVNVNERWNVYCEGVPGVFTTRLYPQVGYDITDVRITDESGKSYVRIFGNASNAKSNYYTVSTSADGVQTFNIYTETTDDFFVANVSYTINGAIINHADAASFEYAIIDEKLLSEIMPSVTVSITTNRELEKFSDFMLNVYSNAVNEISPVNKSQTDVSFMDLPAFTGAAIKVILPLDLFEKNTNKADDYILDSGDYQEPNYFILTPQIWEVFTPSMLFKIDLITRINSFPGGWASIAAIYIIPIGLILLIILYGKRSETNSKTKRPNRTDFKGRYVSDFPDELTFAECARLLEHTNASYVDRPRYFSSILLSLYSKGYVSILSTKRGFKIRLTGKEEEYSLPECEELMLIFIESAIGTNTDCSIDTIAEYMFRNCDKVHSLYASFMDILDKELIRTGMLVYDSDNILHKHFTSKMTDISFWTYIIAITFVAFVSTMMWIMGKGIGFIIMSCFLFLTVILLILSKRLHRSITEKGEISASRWNAFARYLNEAERTISENDIFEYDTPSMMFIYAVAFNANKRALRYLNFLMPWVGEDSEVVLQGTSEGQKYSVSVSGLLQFLDELEKITSDCLKLYESEKGPLYKQKSQKRIASFDIAKINNAQTELN
ncbi:MAG: DUF2207 domain-containing protein [Anaerofustis stercorihominis]|nr:DUF2207 domain-containing protein [Anaerofustis stercorihominis]